MHVLLLPGLCLRDPSELLLLRCGVDSGDSVRLLVKLGIYTDLVLPRCRNSNYTQFS